MKSDNPARNIMRSIESMSEETVEWTKSAVETAFVLKPMFPYWGTEEETDPKEIDIDLNFNQKDFYNFFNAQSEHGDQILEFFKSIESGDQSKTEEVIEELSEELDYEPQEALIGLTYTAGWIFEHDDISEEYSGLNEIITNIEQDFYRSNGDLEKLDLEPRNYELEDVSENPNDVSMTRQDNDADDLGRKARDTRGSQSEMYENLQDIVVELSSITEEVEIKKEEADDIANYLEDIIGTHLEDVERTYDTVSNYVENEVVPAVEEHYASVEAFFNDFRDEEDYSQLETEMGTMRRNTERFREENDLN